MKEPIATAYTKNLSRFIANLKYEDLAPELVDKVKKLTMHVAGVTLAGRPLQNVKTKLQKIIKSF